MRQFPLLVEGAVCNFDTDGRVLDDAANVVGNWNTTAENQIRVTKAQGGGTVDLAVDWAFNAANQLTIGIADNPTLFTIVNTIEGLPRFRLDQNTLVVDPDGDGDFEFRLHCLFGLQADGTLVVSVNGKESAVDGFIEDSNSRFRYQFFDKGLPNFPNSLVFSGQWERKGGDNEIRLHFKPDGAVELAGKPLDLPAAVRVDPHRNHLALIYQSNSHGERRLQFLGSLAIKSGWNLVFEIEDVKDGAVRKSTIKVQASFEFDRGQGTLSLFVGKTKTADSQVIEVGGNLSATIGANAQLTWNFSYRKTTAGGQPANVVIATSVEFKFDQNRIFIEYKQDGKVRQLDVTAKIVQANFVALGGVQIKDDPQGRHLKAFIGVSF